MQLLLEQEGLINLPKNIKRRLIYISNDSTRFKNWFESNLAKIKSKYNGAVTVEDKNDVTAELICAAEMLKSCQLEDIIYEPFGTEQRAPDFKATISGQTLYVEVKRIRQSEIENRRDEFLERFASTLREIKQNYGISIECAELKIDDLNENQIYQRLMSELNNIKEFIEEQLGNITQKEEELSSIDISLERFAENFSISVVKIPSEKQDGKVHYYSGLYDIPYTGREYRKFGDIIFDKIHQLILGSMNVFFVLADNECHEFEDLLESIHSINELITEENEDFFITKGFGGKEDFLTKSKKLGGIIFDNRTNEKKLWINSNANVLLSEEIKKFVHSLNE